MGRCQNVDFPSGGAHGESEERLISFLRRQMVSIISRVTEHVREVQDEVQELKRDLAQRDDRERVISRVAEHVRDVHDEVQELKRDLAQRDDRERGKRTAIDQSSQEMLSLRELLKKTHCRLEQLDSDVATSKRERDRLEAEHEVTKSDLVALNERHLRTANELSDVARAGTDTQCSIQQLVRDRGKAEADLPVEVGRLEKLIDSLKLQHTSRDFSNTEIKTQLFQEFSNYQEDTSKKIDELISRKIDELISWKGQAVKLQRTSRAVSNREIKFQQLFQESSDCQEDTSKKIDELISWKVQAVALMKDTAQGVAVLETELKLLTEGTSDQKEFVAKSLRNVDNTLNSHQVWIERNFDMLQRHEQQVKASESGIGQLQESLGDLKETVQLLSTSMFHVKGLIKHRNVTLSDSRAADSEKHASELDHSKVTSPTSGRPSNMLKLGSRFDHSTKKISPRASRGMYHADDHGLHRPKTPRLPDVPGRSSPQYGLPGH